MSEITKKLESITSRIYLLKEGHYEMYENVVKEEIAALKEDLADIEGELDKIEGKYTAALTLFDETKDIADFHPSQSAYLT